MDNYSSAPIDRCEWNIGYDVIKNYTVSQVSFCLFLARCSLVPLILLGSWFGWRLASEIYGQAAGYLFLILWMFSPLVLGWGATICPDVVAASLGIIAIYYFRRWLMDRTWWNLMIAGITLGLLPLAKLTWIIAFPIALIFWLVNRPWSKNITSQLKQFAAMILIALYVVNMGYGFDGSFKLLKDYRFISRTLSATNSAENRQLPIQGNRFEHSFIGYLPVPLPCEFVQGIDTQKFDFERGMESYFRGQYNQHGWWYYYLYVLGVKEPLGVWCLLAMAIGLTCCRTGNATFRDELLLIFPAIALIVFVSSQTGFSMHPRYVILALPFLYLWVSKLGRIFERPRLFPKIMVAGLLVWIVVSSLLWFPHSMSYFNEIVRSPWHGRSFTKDNPPPLLASNIDWGQNTRLIEKWYRTHPQCRPVFFDCSSPESLDRLGIKSTLPLKERLSGWYVLGINDLFANDSKYTDFQNRTPKEILGYGVYIYYLPDRKNTRNVSSTMSSTISLQKNEEEKP